MVTVTSVDRVMDQDSLAAYGKKVDYLEISPEDEKRRRFRSKTMAGTTVNISINRETELSEGAVLHESDEIIILLRVKSRSQLILEPHSTYAGLQLGFLAGHLHWKTQILERRLRVEVETDVAEYQTRLDDYLDREDYSLYLEDSGDER